MSNLFFVGCTELFLITDLSITYTINNFSTLLCGYQENDKNLEAWNPEPLKISDKVFKALSFI